MADETDTQAPKSKSSQERQERQRVRATGSPRSPATYEEARPADETPGDPAHLGSDRPYEGGPSPFVEGEA